MKGNKGGWLLWTLRTKRLGIPAVAATCALFFLAGLFGSALFSSPQDLPAKVPNRVRMMDAGGEDPLALPHGVTGERQASTVSFQVLSWKPRALYFPNFATAEQCQEIIKMAKVNLTPSALALRKGDTAENTKGVRTSSGTFISGSADSTGTLRQIEEKIARVTMIPREHGEAFNVLRYEIGQRYLSHYDAFDPKDYGGLRSQRIASFLLYLSDVEEGGETVFPYESGLNMDAEYVYEKCIGLKVKPRKGDGLLFYSLYVNGTTIDPHSLHGSCPVIKGEKWVATKWLRTENSYF